MKGVLHVKDADHHWGYCTANHKSWVDKSEVCHMKILFSFQNKLHSTFSYDGMMERHVPYTENNVFRAEFRRIVMVVSS